MKYLPGIIVNMIVDSQYDVLINTDDGVLTFRSCSADNRLYTWQARIISLIVITDIFSI